jgi:lysozyme
MRTSDAGLKLIKKFEGYRDVAYLDAAGVPTIGWGHTRNVRLGMRCTMAQATKWFLEDTTNCERVILGLVKVDLTQEEFDALSSWQFNTGGLYGSTALKKLNAGDYEGCIASMQLWCHATNPVTGKKELNNVLQNRRAEEGVLWHTGWINNANGSPTPLAVPEKVSETTTGKMQIGALASSAAAIISQGLSSIQPVLDAGKSAIGSVSGLSGTFHTVGVVLVVFSIGFTALTLWHKSQTMERAL